MGTLKPYILIAVVVVLVGTIYFINSTSVKRIGADQAVTVVPRVTSDSSGTTSSLVSLPTEVKKDTISNKYLSVEVKSKRYELAKEITVPGGFINTNGKPITINSLVGKKVILVDFWTYSCINCQRTTPYLNAWYEKYKDKGFVIVGVHTPEFEFEKDYNNVKTAVEKFGIKFPVVLDNAFSTWNAYKNRYWPRKYLIDIDGYIVYDHIGEGDYEETEKKIQELLEERRVVLGAEEDIAKDTFMPVQTIETNSAQTRSPEIYFGASRNNSLGNGSANMVGLQNLSGQKGIKKNFLYLSGSWNFEDEFAENKSGQAKIFFRYQAKNVYFVARSDSDIRIKVLNDGKQIEEQTIKEAQTYTLISDSDYGDHTLEIIIEDPGLQAFTFTFG